MEPLPEHIWEYTVQVENGDWHWTRSRKPIDFREAVVEALDYESSLEGGRLVSIANVDPKPDDGPSEAQKLHRAGYPIR